jgi:hypothetical protein
MKPVGQELDHLYKEVTVRSWMTTTTLQVFSHIIISHDVRNLPIAMLLVLAFLAAVSIAVIYPSTFVSLTEQKISVDPVL